MLTHYRFLYELLARGEQHESCAPIPTQIYPPVLQVVCVAVHVCQVKRWGGVAAVLRGEQALSASKSPLAACIDQGVVVALLQGDVELVCEAPDVRAWKHKSNVPVEYAGMRVWLVSRWH